MNPSQVHAMLAGQNQVVLGGGSATGGAMLLILGKSIPCTHGEILENSKFIGGKSPMTIVPQCEFLVADIPGATPSDIGKGIAVRLTPTPGGKVFDLKLDEGGLLPGGQEYRFKLVDRNYTV